MTRKKWNYSLLKLLAQASGKNPNGLRRTISQLAADLKIRLEETKCKEA